MISVLSVSVLVVGVSLASPREAHAAIKRSAIVTSFSTTRTGLSTLAEM
jgi:hypothetical protein